MLETDVDRLQRLIRKAWLSDHANQKVRRYINEFFERTRIGSKIVARVKGVGPQNSVIL